MFVEEYGISLKISFRHWFNSDKKDSKLFVDFGAFQEWALKTFPSETQEDSVYELDWELRHRNKYQGSGRHIFTNSKGLMNKLSWILIPKVEKVLGRKIDG